MKGSGMDYWQLIHRYRYLVNQGVARPLGCPDCGNEVTTLIGVDENPVLWCPYEDALYRTGTQFWADIRAVVTEHFME